MQPLKGNSDRIHELNKFIGVDIQSPELAAEYIRFFSIFSSGTNAWGGGSTIVEEVSDAQLLGDNKPPISYIFKDELALFKPMITPLFAREGSRNNPVKGCKEKEIHLRKKARSDNIDKLEYFYVIGATFIRNRRFFYSEFIMPKTRIDPFGEIEIAVYENESYPIVMSPLPVRLIGSSLVHYTLDQRYQNLREEFEK